MGLFVKKFQVLRPKHWMKSGFCLAALFFSFNASNFDAWLLVGPLLVVFSLIASAGYVLNDLTNLKEDRAHPRKRHRAIASGVLPVWEAIVWLFLVFSLAFSTCYLSYGYGAVFWCCIAYVTINTAYTLLLRRIPLLDLSTISLGFVLRVVAGAYAIGVQPSEWLMLLTYLLALLLGLGKRQGEVQYLEQTATTLGKTRSSLRWYVKAVNANSLRVVAFVLWLFYVAYCIVVQKGYPFILTAIPVGGALYFYAAVAATSSDVEAPETMLLRRWPILLSFLVWLMMVVYLMYAGGGMEDL